ncbi:MAG: hypothetical protein ABSB42_04960 [Tepidisphaeraceae bacterium]
MSRKTCVLTLAVGGVCCFGVSKASAQNTFLPGNVWPNPDLSTSVVSSGELNGVDQIYSYYNGTPAQWGTIPNTVGDANPRPAGWHRGGGDFGVQTAPNFCLYNTPGNSAGEGTAPAGTAGAPTSTNPPSGPLATPGYALEVSDSSITTYGEWFSDWNPLPAAVVANPATTGFELRFYYEDTAPQPRDGQLRVTINFGTAVSNDILTGDPANLGHVDTTFNFPSAGVDTWTEEDIGLNAPVGSESARITIDTGGGNDTLGNIWVSDISVAVPEPCSIAGATVGSMLLLARRRRRA